MDFGVSSKNLLRHPIDEGLGKDSIAIIVVDYDKVFHSLGGSDREASRLVRSDSAGLCWDFLEGCINAVCSFTVFKRRSVETLGVFLGVIKLFSFVVRKFFLF